MAELNSFAKIETNFNAEPYYDDWIKSKGFLRILFKPGTAVQARELSQLQTILGDQISQLADNSLVEGSIIRGGEITLETGENSLARKFEIDTNSKFYEQLQQIISNEAEDWREILIGNSLVYGGDHNGVETTIKFTIVDIIEPSTSTQNLSLVGVYESEQAFSSDISNNIYTISNNINKNFSFTYNKTVNGSPLNDIFQRVEEAGESQIIILEAGACSFVNIKEGVIYSKGCLVYFPEATKVISTTSTTETAKIGIQVYENIVTSAEDSSLFDNAVGSTNENAPGADRFKISAELAVKSLDTSGETTYGAAKNNDFLDFYELTRLADGVRIDVVLESPYKEIEDIIAERIYDLAGDFLVNKGDYGISFGEYLGEDPAKLDNHFGLYVNPGKAYIEGYEVEKSNVTYIEIPAERSFTPIEEKIKFQSGDSYSNYFLAKINTSPTLTSGSGAYAPLDLELTELQNLLADGQITLQQSVVGTAASDIVTTTEPHRLKTGVKLNYASGAKYTDGFVERLNSKTFALHESLAEAEAGASNTRANVPAGDFEGIVTVGTAKIRDFRFKNDLTTSNNFEVGTDFHQDFLELYVYDISLEPNTNVANTNIATDGTDKIFDIIRSEDGTVLREPSKNSMLYRLPDKRIHSISDMSYIVSSSTVITTSAGTNQISIDASAAGVTGGYFIEQTIGSAELSEYLDEVIVYKADIDDSTNPPTILSTKRLEYFKLDYLADELKIDLTAEGDSTIVLNQGDSVLVFYKVHKPVAGARTKTYTEDYVETDVAVDSNGIATLEKYNVISIKEVKLDDGSDEGELIDPSLYSLKSGQTENYYDFSSIKFFGTSNATLKSVTYNYFEFDSKNEPFLVSSYNPAESRFLDKFTDVEGNVIELADCLDFRRPKAEGIFPIANDANANFDLYYTVYYSRYDKLVLNKQGDFSLIQGQPSKTPQLPSDESNALTLWNLYVQPYTYKATEIQSTSVAKVRRRVKDIALIDEDLQATKKKISLIEKELEVVKKAKDGDDKNRTSMATLTDDFSQPLTIDFADPETNCTIDTYEGSLKPQYTVDNYKFITDSNDNYKQGDIISAESTAVAWADNFFLSTPKNNNFWRTDLEDGFLTGGYLYEFVIENINSGVGYVRPISGKINSPSVNLYPEVEIWKDNNIVPNVSESINNNLYKAYEDLKESGSNNKEILAVTWPITTTSDVNGTPESLIQNDFGEIVYDKNIIESLAENTVVFKVAGFPQNSQLSLELGKKTTGFHSFPVMVFSTTKRGEYDKIDVNESTFPYELTLNVDESGTSVAYEYKIVHKYETVDRVYYEVLPKELFDKTTTSESKYANRETYYQGRTILSAFINSEVNGTLTSDVTAGASLTGYVGESNITAIRTNSSGAVRGAICIIAGKYTNTTQLFSVEASSKQRATKQYYALLDAQDKIISQNKTRLVDTSSGTEDTSNLLQPFVVRESNGVYLDSIDIAFMNSTSSGDVSIYITKKKDGVYQNVHVPGSFKTLSSFVPSTITTQDWSSGSATWSETKTVPGENKFVFDSPLYLDPGDYAIGFVGSSTYQVCVLSTTADATLKAMPNSKTFINCRINRRSFTTASNTTSLKLAEPPANLGETYSLLNLNGTFISGLTGSVGPSFTLRNGPDSSVLIPNKNIESQGSGVQLDSLTRVDFSMSGSSYTSPLVDLQTLNLIAVKYKGIVHSSSKPQEEINDDPDNFIYISKAVRLSTGNKANSVLASADIFVPTSGLKVKAFIKTDSDHPLDDDLNEWLEIPISQEESETSKTSSLQSSNKNDTKRFVFKNEDLEPYMKAKLKLIMYNFTHFEVPVVQAFDGNFYLTTERTS